MVASHAQVFANPSLTPREKFGPLVLPNWGWSTPIWGVQPDPFVLECYENTYKPSSVATLVETQVVVFENSSLGPLLLFFFIPFLLTLNITPSSLLYVSQVTKSNFTMSITRTNVTTPFCEGPFNHEGDLFENLGATMESIVFEVELYHAINAHLS